MVKLEYGSKLCKISSLPYQAFRWKAGPQGRYKETIISFAVAKERNICQTCLNDMEFGLPVGVRDTLLQSSSQPKDLNGQSITAPTSDVGNRFHYQQVQDNLDLVEYNKFASVSDAITNMPAQRELEKFGKLKSLANNNNNNSSVNNKTPAFRNLPKLCSFWLSGSCGRVVRKTCPFRPCCGIFIFPEIASHKESMTSLISELELKGPAVVQTKLSNELKILFKESMKGKYIWVFGYI